VNPFLGPADQKEGAPRRKPPMPRKSVVLIAAAAALSSAVVAANIARSRAVGPYLNLTKADFDQVFTDASASAVVSAKLDAGKLRQLGLKRIDLTR
jgi:hypothetical protein